MSLHPKYPDLWVPCRHLWECTKLRSSRMRPGVMPTAAASQHINICCLNTKEPLHQLRATAGPTGSSWTHPPPKKASLQRGGFISDILIMALSDSKACVLHPGWVENISESRTRWGDEMHAYHVMLNLWQKEKTDLQSSVQRLFYMQNSSWIQLLFSLIKNKQR